MNDDFFADYKKFIVIPEDEKLAGNEVFDPINFSSHYILTLSIFDSRLSNWNDASKFEINVENSIEMVLKEFNQKQHECYHLQLLELDKFKNYFILALSSKTNFKPNEEVDRIAFIVDKMLTNPFYVGQRWYSLISQKGRVERKLFCYSFMKYNAPQQQHTKTNKKYDNISEIISKNGEIKLINNL